MAFNFGSLLGPGLMLGGSLLDREPGEELEARQALRNVSNLSGNNLLGTTVGNVQGAFAPYLQPGPAQQFLTQQFQAPADPFSAGGLYEQYLPRIEQQKQTLLNDVQQRAAAGLPGSLSPAMGGAELAAIRNATANQIAPSYQALFADLTRENMNRQLQAAQNVLGQEESMRNFVGNQAQFALGSQADAAANLLRLSQPDPFADSLAKLGTMLTYGQLSGGGGQGGIGGLLGSLLGGGQGQAGAGAGAGQPGQGGVGGLLQQVLGQIPGLPPGLAQLLGPLLAGAGGTLAGNALGQNLFGSTDQSGLAGTTGGGIGAILGGLLGSVVPGLGTAIGAGLGGAAGGLLGAGTQQPDESRKETLQGALGGAFGPLGSFFATQGDNLSTGERLAMMAASMVPGLGPLIGGILGKQSGAAAEKAAFRQNDLDSQTDQIHELGNFGATTLQRFGASPQQVSEWTNYVGQLAATSESPADEQGMVAQRMGELLLPLARAKGFQSLDAVPGLRQEFLQFMTQNTFTSGNSSFGGGAPTNLIGNWASIAGLEQGGITTQPTMAMVGERGPEAALLAPGSMVLPTTPGAALQPQSPQNRLAGIVPLGTGQAQGLDFLMPQPMLRG